jgi:DNA processing protein
MTATSTAVDEADRLARVALSCAAEPGYPRLLEDVRELGAVAVLTGLRGQVEDGKLGGDLAERLRTVDPARELVRAEAGGLRFVVPGDREWPT